MQTSVIPAAEPTQSTPVDVPNTFENNTHVPQLHKTIAQPSSSMDTNHPSPRPQRVRKRPVYLDDYVTSDLPSKENKEEEEVTAPGC